MACGSVAKSEGVINLASLGVTRRDPSASSATPEKSETPISKRNKQTSRSDDVHEAVLFLQREHEKILTGLHQQIENLQQKCDDLQFETHLRHVIPKEETALKKRIAELTVAALEKDRELAKYKAEFEEQEKILEQERQTHRWKELKLQQQIEVSDQRTAELKAEVARLKGQVRDLKIFSSALRISSRPNNTTSTGVGRPLSASRRPPTPPKTASLSLHRTSQESLDSLGPRSLGSEEGDLGMWRESRLGAGVGKYPSHRVKRPQSSQPLQPGSLPPLSPPASLTRPSSSLSTIMPLPPIQSQSSNRPHVRRQLRLFSAPALDPLSDSPRKPP